MKIKSVSIRYGSQGVAPAPAYFNINPQTGEINITQGLSTDRRTSYTVSMKLITIMHTAGNIQFN